MVKSIPKALTRPHPKDPSGERQLAYVNFVDPVTGRRRQRVLGDAGTPRAERAYRDFVKAYVTGLPAPEPETQPQPVSVGITVGTLAARWLRWADTYYVNDDGKPAAEARNCRCYVRPMNRLFADTPVATFGSRKLLEVRDAMIEDGLCRSEVNRRVNRIRQVFRWGVEQELVPPMVLEALRSVQPIRKGKLKVRESEPVRPVTWEQVEPVLAHVSRQVAAMILVQWHSGARPGEVCGMRTADLDMSGEQWIYNCTNHKNAHRGRARHIALLPAAREVIRPFLKADPDAFLFSPADAESERMGRLRDERQTPVQPSQMDRRKPNPKHKPGDRYTTQSYARAITRGCEALILSRIDMDAIPGWEGKGDFFKFIAKRDDVSRACAVALLADDTGVHPWAPNRLRHRFATATASKYGFEVARALMGHSTTSMTSHYADREAVVRAAAQVVREVG